MSYSHLFSQTLSDEDLYIRCYTQFTGNRIPKNDSRLISIKEKKLNYINGCMDLLKSAEFGNDGIIKTIDPQTGKPVHESQRVLQTFNDFHRNWFESLDFNNWNQNEIYDNGEMAYHLSHALFTTKPFSKIISDENTYEALRYSPNNVFRDKSFTGPLYDSASSRLWVSQVKTLYTNKWGWGMWRSIPYKPRIPQAGVLIGIQTMPMDEDPIPFLNGTRSFQTPDPYLNVKKDTPTFNSLVSRYIDLSKMNVEDFKYSDLKAHTPYGSGIIGTVPYLLLNHGRPDYWSSDGVVSLPRRWSKAVVKDLLCRELPVLRKEDVSSLVNVNSATPFRASASCMACHGTMDPLAYGIRNMSTVSSAFSPWTQNEDGTKYFDINGNETTDPSLAYRRSPFTPFHIRKYEILKTDTSPFLKQTEDPDFYLKPPVGQFNFRTYDGKLIAHTFTDLQGNSSLGEHLKDLDDLYICAAKKYYQFLTGIDVPIYDFTDPTYPQAGAEELSHRNKVVSLGKNLKNHQSLQLLIKEIISLDLYKERGFGAK